MSSPKYCRRRPIDVPRCVLVSGSRWQRRCADVSDYWCIVRMSFALARDMEKHEGKMLDAPAPQLSSRSNAVIFQNVVAQHGSKIIGRNADRTRQQHAVTDIVVAREIFGGELWVNAGSGDARRLRRGQSIRINRIRPRFGRLPPENMSAANGLSRTPPAQRRQ